MRGGNVVVKQIVSLLLAAGVLAGVLGGCGEWSDQQTIAGYDMQADDDADAMSAARDKAEQISFYDGEGSLLCTLDVDEDLNSLFDMIWDDVEWEWGEDEESEEAPSKVELTAVFSQRPTQTVLGPKVEEDDREELLRLTVYEGGTAELQALLFKFRAELPKDVLDALYEAAGL